MKSYITKDTEFGDFNNPDFAKKYKNIESYTIEAIETYIQEGIGKLDNANDEVEDFMENEPYYDASEVINDAICKLIQQNSGTIFVYNNDNKDLLEKWNNYTKGDYYLGDIPAILTGYQKELESFIDLSAPNDVMLAAVSYTAELIGIEILDKVEYKDNSYPLSVNEYKEILDIIESLKNNDDFLGDQIDSCIN